MEHVADEEWEKAVKATYARMKGIEMCDSCQELVRAREVSGWGFSAFGHIWCGRCANLKFKMWEARRG